jgi:putative transposase
VYARHRFPTETISYIMWLFTFSLSYRDVRKLLYRGIEVSYEAIRSWCNKSGQQYASEIRHRHPHRDKWHLNEVIITINGAGSAVLFVASGRLRGQRPRHFNAEASV